MWFPRVIFKAKLKIRRYLTFNPQDLYVYIHFPCWSFFCFPIHTYEDLFHRFFFSKQEIEFFVELKIYFTTRPMKIFCQSTKLMLWNSSHQLEGCIKLGRSQGFSEPSDMPQSHLRSIYKYDQVEYIFTCDYISKCVLKSCIFLSER